MTRSFYYGILAVWCGLVLGLKGQVFLEERYGSLMGVPIPDGLGTGLSSVCTVNQSLIRSIQSVSVRLEISGDFNGDLYGYLRHENGLAVLLNRPGKSALNPYGYSDTGLAVTLTDSAPNDLHVYQDYVQPERGSALSGEWQPDGRYIDPVNVLDTTTRMAPLGSFIGLEANGDWTLFLADLELGGKSQLDSWELVLTGVPEPGPATLVTGLFLVLVSLSRQWRRKTRTNSMISRHLNFP